MRVTPNHSGQPRSERPAGHLDQAWPGIGRTASQQVAADRAHGSHDDARGSGIRQADERDQWLRRSGQARRPAFTLDPRAKSARSCSGPHVPSSGRCAGQRRQTSAVASPAPAWFPSIRHCADVTVACRRGGASRLVRSRARAPVPLAHGGTRPRSWQPTPAPPRVRRTFGCLPVRRLLHGGRPGNLAPA
jgi:hypothetical protein